MRYELFEQLRQAKEVDSLAVEEVTETEFGRWLKQKEVKEHVDDDDSAADLDRSLCL